jgi:hypothetical protein
MMKLALMRTATGKEDPELPLQHRISLLELTAPQIAAQINASQISRSLKVSSSAVEKPSSAMMKLALMGTATGKEDPEVPLVQRISSLELTALQIAAQINASQSSSNRHISTSTVQRRLCESDLYGRITAKKPLLKETNKKKTCLGQETRAMDIEIFASNHRVFVSRRVGEQKISASVVPTVKHGGGGGVMVLCW